MPTQPPQDRVVTSVPAMPIVPLGIEHVFDAKTGKPRLDRLKEHFLKEGRLDAACAKRIIAEASALFRAEPNLLDLRYPITVCGDIHGQYYDLIRLFDVGGDPKDTQYLFLGDYVDRGCFSCEVVFYLYAHKIFYPKTFFMLRGNHECRQLTSFFNFKDECQYKYSVEMYDLIMDSFDHLPIGAMVNKSFFCVHGGLSPEIATLSDISALDRHQETPREGPMCDLLWSDPFDEDGEGGHSAMSDADAVAGDRHAVTLNTSASAATWFVYNETRQCSYVYGADAVRQFLDDNKVTSIIRAHEAQVDGYKMHMVNKETGIPRVITIFSAPNYCDVYKNKAACLKFDHPNILNIKQFVETQHPYFLPNFMDVFQWSLPFVAEKVTDMLASVLEFDAAADTEEDRRAKPLEQRGNLLKKKVMAVTKLVRLYKVLREQSEAIVQLKQLAPNNKIPLGVLSSGAEGIKDALSAFEKARVADRESERHPCPSPPTAMLQRRFSRTFSTDSLPTSPVLGLRVRPEAAAVKPAAKEGEEEEDLTGFASPTVKIDSH